MKILRLEVDDSIFERFRNFLGILPKSKIKIEEIYDDTYIDFVKNEGQKDIETILCDKDCHSLSHSRLIKL